MDYLIDFYKNISNKKGLVVMGLFVLIFISFNILNFNSLFKDIINIFLVLFIAILVFVYLIYYIKFKKTIERLIFKIDIELKSIEHKIYNLKKYSNYLNFVDDIFILENKLNKYLKIMKNLKNKVHLFELDNLAKRIAYLNEECCNIKLKIENDLRQKKSTNSKKTICLNILGLNNKITLDELKSRYRFLVKKYHPDVNNGNDIKFKEISQAYNYLKTLYIKNIK